MKIILEDKDEDFNQKINHDLDEVQNPILFCSEKRSYSCSFDVLDIAKANAFIYGIMMNSNKEHLEELEELIGIRFTSLNYETDVKLKELKVMLKNFMEQLNRI